MIIKSFSLDHFNDRPNQGLIDTIVLHSMYCPFPEGQDALDPEVCIQWLDRCQVSSHFMIAQNGQVYQLVDPKNRAWHAGKSQMPDGREGVNDFSIGIELISPAGGSYSESQIIALQELLNNLQQDYPIQYILGHQDIAVDREGAGGQPTSSVDDYLVASKNEPKTDPWNFPWDKLKF